MILLIVAIVFGAIGAAVASGKGRNPFLWFIICALVPLIGLLILACLSNQKVATEALPAARTDLDERWDNLAKFDPDIRAAVGRLEPFGLVAVSAFKVIYSDVQDKASIPSIVAEIESATTTDRAKMAKLTFVEMSCGLPIFQNLDRTYLVGEEIAPSLSAARGLAGQAERKRLAAS